MREPTLGALLERARGFPRGIRFIDRAESETFFSYEEIFQRAARIAGGSSNEAFVLAIEWPSFCRLPLVSSTLSMGRHWLEPSPFPSIRLSVLAAWTNITNGPPAC